MRSFSILLQSAVVSVVILAVLAGCGGTGQAGNPGASSSASSAGTTPSSTPTPPSPPPTPSPSPTPTPNPTPFPSTSFVAALISLSDNTNHGQISINMNGENGAGNIQLKNAQPNSAYGISFCAFPTESAPRGNQDCTAVSPDFITDAGGNANVNFQFSRSGTWSGIFSINNYASGFDMPSNGTEYQSPLKRSSAITGPGAGVGPIGSDPLGSGYVAISGRAAHFSVSGAAPNAAYVASYCDNNFSTSACHVLGNINTDGDGNAAVDLDYIQAAGNFNTPGIFYLSRNDGGTVKSEFASAFTVP